MPAKARKPKAPLAGVERALRRAAVFVSEAGEFRLAVAIFPHPIREEHWIRILIAEAEKENVHLTVCSIPAEGNPRVSDLLSLHLQEVPTLPGHTRAVIVTGISPHLPDASTSRLEDAPRPRMAGELNLDRELFERRCPCPLILALTTTSHSQLLRHAPDLMHWCSQTFDFSEPLPEDLAPASRGMFELQSVGPGETYANLTELHRAERVFRDGLASATAAYGAESPRTLEVRSNLANVLHQLGQPRDALALARANMAIVEKSPDLPDAQVALQCNQLANFLRESGLNTEAEPLMRRALAIAETSFGCEHPNVARGLNNLAQLLKSTNRLSEAEPLMRRALEIHETCLGNDHPDVAVSLNNLAGLLYSTNRFAEAESLLKRVIKILENKDSQPLPNYAGALNNLAELLRSTNRLAEAEPIMRRALAIEENSFGSEHPNVARGLNNLAQLLKATNRLAEAEPLMRRALEIHEASFGREHPSVAISLTNLAGLLRDTNRFSEAETLIRKALAIDESYFGSGHSDVATDLNNLAMVLVNTKRFAEAEPLIRRALAIDEKSLGYEHLNVARDLNNLAILLCNTDRLSEAEPLMQRHLKIYVNSALQSGYLPPNLKTAIGNYVEIRNLLGDTNAQIEAKIGEIMQPIKK